MAKLKIKNLNKVKTTIRKKIVLAARSSEIRKGVASTIVEQIKDGDFGRPSESYRDWREENESRNKTDKKYDIDKINITFTGELLGDLEKNAKLDIKGKKLSYVLEHSNKLHKSYKTSKGRTKRSTFKKISDGVQKYYPYLTFSRKTQKKVLKFIQDNIFKKLK